LGPIALAVLKRSTPADADLLVDGIAASQEIVVAAEKGPRPQVARNRLV
jgi:hypothetical protein